jgi:hypothetical protein
MSDDDDDDEIMGNPTEDPKSLHIAVAVLQAKMRLVSYLIRHDLVTRYEFAPVKLIAFGIAGLVITSVLVAILSYVLLSKQ